MHFRGLDHNWTALNTSVNDHQDAYKIYSHKQFTEEVWGAFDHICFSVNGNES